MRIAIDATYSVDPNPSGIAVYSRELTTRLATSHPEDSFIHCFRVKQFRKAPQSARPNTINRLLLPPLPTFHCDLFHALNQRVDKRPAARVVSTFHDLFVLTGEYSSPEFRARFADQARRAAQHSDLVVAVSQFTANQVHDFLEVPTERIRVIPHGVIQPALRQNTRREKMILFVGALQKRKNISRLVGAFENMPNDWRLVLAGSQSGFGVDAILNEIAQSRAHPRILLPGYISTEQLEGLYAKASIFAFPSLDEGFGMPVLDAMARGVPVLTSNRSALPEVAGDAALLIDPYDEAAIAGALNKLIHDEGLRANLAAKGLSRSGLFSWEKAANDTYAAYKELLYF